MKAQTSSTNDIEYCSSAAALDERPANKIKQKHIISIMIIGCILLGIATAAIVYISKYSSVNKSIGIAPTESKPSTNSQSRSLLAASSAFGVNIYSTDQNFDISMVEDLILNKNIYHFRSFASWGRTDAVLNTLNTYSSSGTSLLFNIAWSESVSSYSSFNDYNFDIKIQFDSCGWPSCSNPTEGGFCQGDYDTSSYITKLQEADSLFNTDIEFVIPWQNDYVCSSGEIGQVLQAALTIQQTNGRAFSLSGTFYNFFHGPDVGGGVFPEDSINSLYTSVQSEVSTYASGLSLGLRVAETAWPDQCDSGSDKGYGEASTSNLCSYYNQAIAYSPSNDIMIYWWIIDDRDVGDGCGEGAWGLYDTSTNFKC